MGKKLERLTRDELKAHLAARKLTTDGSKKELIDRLKVSREKSLSILRIALVIWLITLSLFACWTPACLPTYQKSLDADVAREESYHKELDEERRMLGDLEER